MQRTTVKISKELAKELRIMAVLKGITLQDQIEKFLIAGIRKEKKKDNK